MNSKKHIQITGISNISWKDAIVKTVSEANETIYNLCNLTVLEQRAKIVDGKIAEYYVDLDIEFEIDNQARCSCIPEDNLDE